MKATINKYCPGCKTTRKGGCFSLDRTRSDGLSVYCDICLQERRSKSNTFSKWYEKNRTKHIENVMRRMRERGYKRKKDTVIHVAASATKTMCGISIRRVKIVVPYIKISEIMKDEGCEKGCERCRKSCEVLWRCEPLPNMKKIAGKITGKNKF